MYRSSFLWLLLLALALNTAAPVAADAKSSQGKHHDNHKDNQKIAASVEAGDGALLKNFRNAVSRIRNATLDIVNDIGQRKMAALSSDPLFIYPTQRQENKDPKLYLDEMKDDLGNLEAPKKSWLDADVAHLQKWIGVFNADVASMSKINNAGAAQPIKDISSVQSDINSHFKQLQTLTQGPKFDNLAIGAAALAIHDDVKKLEAPWKELTKALR
jgi:hypothetical protein